MTKFVGEYPDDWREIKDAKYEEVGGHCERCGHVNDASTWHILTVHHLDNDKANCRWWNLAALCQRCHLTIQGRVNVFQRWPFEHSEWFKPYVAGFYAWTILYLDLTRDQVEARLDDLLAVGQPEVYPENDVDPDELARFFRETS